MLPPNPPPGPMRHLLALSALLLAAPVASESVHPALEPFARLVGQWEGPAEARSAQGVLAMHQTEDVRVALGGNLILIEGLGRRLDADGAPGETAFNAHGVFSVEAETGTVYLDAFTAEGRHTRVVPVATEDGFEWSITPEAGPQIHYVMRFDESGRWVETGRVSLDGGATWTPFFEMTLERVAE